MMSPDEELQVVRRAAKGDKLAFRKLYDAYLPRVLRQVQRLLGPGGEIEDVTQNVFVTVYKSLPKFRFEAKFSTWLYRLTWNVSMTHMRRKRPITYVDLTALRHYCLQDEIWGQLEARDKLKMLYAALDQLSENYREAFVLYEIEGMTLQEIADMTETSLNTIASRVRRAREKLRGLLDQLERSGAPSAQEVQA